jgi:hypothetical protein
VANDMESSSSREERTAGNGSRGWLRFALLTAASAVAGGLATAWFYRKTLVRLRETGENPQNPHFGMTGEDPVDGSSDEI